MGDWGRRSAPSGGPRLEEGILAPPHSLEGAASPPIQVGAGRSIEGRGFAEGRSVSPLLPEAHDGGGLQLGGMGGDGFAYISHLGIGGQGLGLGDCRY